MGQRLGEIARTAEDSGFSSVWVMDHYFQIPLVGAAEMDMLEAMLSPEEVYPFHVSLINHGRGLCKAQRPLCAECPLNDRCPAAPLYLGTKSRRRFAD